MNYAQRKRFMKAAWLAHFTYRVPGGVIVDTMRARRRQPGEAVLDLELEAMGLSRNDVNPPVDPEPVEVQYQPPVADEAPTIPMAKPAPALLLGYNPAEE